MCACVCVCVCAHTEARDITEAAWRTRADTNENEMDFAEFLDCMRLLHKDYIRTAKTLKENLDKNPAALQGVAAVQAKFRGDAQRNMCIYSRI